MTFYKTFSNGLRLVVKKIDGLFSVSCGILVKTGSMNESESENGLSHFIEHTVFKGTEKRNSFQISDDIDKIGAQINAFTSKEITCYYTKSISEHLEKCMDVLSDLFFNATFEEGELAKEKGVVTEEIKMTNDTPEDLCFDLLAKSYYGDVGLGRTILGETKNVKSFTKADILAYMDKYYTADNVVISICGNVEINNAVELVSKYFADKFVRFKSKSQFITEKTHKRNLYKYKKTEQSHLGFVFPAVKSGHDLIDAVSIANTVFGGGMSSRLFQRVREKLGLCYSIYSYPSAYKDNGIIEIYAGVNTDRRDLSVNAIADEINRFNRDKISENEFLSGKEQVKSSFIMSQENTASQMILYGKCLLILNKEFSFEEKMKILSDLTLNDVNGVIEEYFTIDKMSTATLGPTKSPLKI